MPWYMFIYISVFAAILLANTIHWFLFKQKLIIVFYCLAAGMYLIFLVTAYFTPYLKEALSLANIPPMLAIIALDFYFSMRKKRVDIKELMPTLDEEAVQVARQFCVVEIAKSIPVLITAPAYIICALLAADLICRLIN